MEKFLYILNSSYPSSAKVLVANRLDESNLNHITYTKNVERGKIIAQRHDFIFMQVPSSNSILIRDMFRKACQEALEKIEIGVITGDYYKKGELPFRRISRMKRLKDMVCRIDLSDIDIFFIQ